MNARRVPKTSDSQHRFLWVVDPWDTLDHPRDTTLLLAKTAEDLGFVSKLAHPESFILDPTKKTITAETWDTEHRVCTPNTHLETFTQIHYRIDPPVDHTYRAPLELLFAAGLPVINSPQTLLRESEKLIACSLPNLAPLTQVVGSVAALHHLSHQKDWQAHSQWVLKPLHQAQSKGVILWRPQSSSSPSFADGPLVVQPFLPQIHQTGELRTWWVRGEFLAGAYKFPLIGDFKVQIDAGSRIEPLQGPNGGLKKVPIQIRRKFPAVKKLLLQKKIHLAAVDWIDQWISDFNFTSPGLLVQMQTLSSQLLAPQVILKLAALPLRSASRSAKMQR